MISAEPNTPGRGRTVQVRVCGAVVGITCAGDGTVHVAGDRAEIDAILRQHIDKSALSRGWSLGDALRIARGLERECNAEIMDPGAVVADIRAGWVRLLEAHLLPDAGHRSGSHMHEFHLRRELTVRVEVGAHWRRSCGGPLGGGTFYLGDPVRLIVRPAMKTKWSVRWENIARISFSYLEPPQ